MKIESWGVIDYETSSARQAELVERVSAGGEDTLVLCTHPPVVTMGRATTADDILDWQGPKIETPRGGRATYHGPNQLIIYPILNLANAHAHFQSRDIHSYLRALEEVTVQCLKESGVGGAEARTTQQGDLSLTGVWVGDHKIASIGIAVRKWVSYHGVAINLFDDPNAFVGIRPCGFNRSVMTSLEAVLGHKPEREWVERVYASAFARWLT